MGTRANREIGENRENRESGENREGRENRDSGDTGEIEQKMGKVEKLLQNNQYCPRKAKIKTPGRNYFRGHKLHPQNRN